MRAPGFSFFCMTFALLGTGSAAAETPSQEEELAMAFADKSFVSLATGTRVPAARVPAVATVITAEDIAATGASSLEEILESVPGLHVSRSPVVGYTPLYIIRGIRGTLTNPEVLMLVNGIPVTVAFAGDRGLAWGGLPLENIARIEIIRGPGSALHGADAFAGVINLITKTARQAPGTRLGLRAGSFHSAAAWIHHGGQAGPLEVAAYLGVSTTDGSREAIPADAQTANDAAAGTSASLAPGPVSTGYKGVDGSVDVSRDAWRWRAGYKRRDRVGSGAGLAQALDPAGQNSSERMTSDLTHSSRLAQAWNLTLQASWMRYEERSRAVLFPAGTTFTAAFPEGMIGEPDKWERHWRLSATAVHDAGAGHRVRLGAGHEANHLYRVRESRNYTYTLVPGLGNVPTPLPGLVDVSDTAPFLTPHKRRLNYLLAQDEWSFAKDWTLTAGVRHDAYSGFGTTTNPRVALVWEAAYNLTAKLLHGRAFRAPAFTELYNVNNPVALGNPSLKPETIETTEGVIAWQATDTFQLGLNVFRYRVNDLIVFTANPDPATGATAQNGKRQSGHGLEIEGTWELGRELRLNGNYAFQRSRDEASGQDAGLAPRHHAYVRADWRLAAGAALDVRVNHVAQRKRQPGDLRDEVPDYTTLDMTLRGERGGWELRASVLNMFDTDAREPSPAPGLIPQDLPLPGRAAVLQLSRQL